MKILHIKIPGVLNEKGYVKLKKRIINELKEGFIITDDSFKVEVIEVDRSEVEVGYYD